VGRKQVYIDRKNCSIFLSAFFFWYGEDFIKAAGTKLAFVKKYLSEKDLEFIEDNQMTISYIKFDWSLNQQDKKEEKEEKKEEGEEKEGEAQK